MNERFIYWIKLLILSLLQGFTEILPISSSGHILLFETLLQLTPSLFFIVFLHLGSMLAVFLFFHKEITRIIKSFFMYLFHSKREEHIKKDFHFCIMLIIASFPAGIIGVLFNDFIEKTFYQPIFVIFGFYLTALLLFLLRYFKSNRKESEMNWKDALLIGLSQAIGIIPGISRSGITISALKARHFDDESATHFSFYMLMPVTFGSFIVETIQLIKSPVTIVKANVFPISVCVIVSFVTTFISLQIFLKIIKKGKLWYFSLYLIILSTVFIFLLK